MIQRYHQQFACLTNSLLCCSTALESIHDLAKFQEFGRISHRLVRHQLLLHLRIFSKACSKPVRKYLAHQKIIGNYFMRGQYRFDIVLYS